jgi:ATP-binding cassette subfamily F protein 1
MTSSHTETYFSESDLTIKVNGKTLINSSELVINSGIKYFLIGKNGCGKTTLLKYLYSKLSDTQDVLLIEQDIVINSTQTINEFILNAKPELYSQYLKLQTLEQELNLSDDQYKELEEISQLLNENCWFQYESQAKKILHGLGFSDINLNVKILSGGWRMRLALGKALLIQPKILLLDEPTNHLDLDAVIWLTDYLSTYKNTIITVSHQMEFINNLSDIIWFIGNPDNSGTKLYKFKGNYYNYLSGLKLINKETSNKYEKLCKQIEQMKKKSTPKKEVEEFIKINNVVRPEKPYVPVINFSQVPTINSSNVIQFKDVDFSYGTNSVLKNINLSIGMDSRIVLVGANGSGKTSFFKLCAQILKPTTGDVVVDPRVKVGWFHQQLIDTLPLDLTPIEYLKTVNAKLSDNECRMYLSKIGLKKTLEFDLCTGKISELSGGQKSRVAFSAIQVSEPNIILMDEPTNHLDIESIEALCTGINEYNGGVLLITHDVHLIKSLNNSKIYWLKDKTIEYFNGDFADYKNILLD